MKLTKSGWGAQRLGLEFRMELATQKPGVILQLHDLHEISVGRVAGHLESVAHQDLLVFAIELVAMTVSLGDLSIPVDSACQRAFVQQAGIGAQPHGAAHGIHSQQVSQLVDDPVWDRGIELGTVGVQGTDVARELDHDALHPEADSETGHPADTGMPDRPDHPFDAADSEAARNQNGVQPFQPRFVVVPRPDPPNRPTGAGPGSGPEARRGPGPRRDSCRTPRSPRTCR